MYRSVPGGNLLHETEAEGLLRFVHLTGEEDLLGVSTAHPVFQPPGRA